jgi:hypothetical protein
VQVGQPANTATSFSGRALVPQRSSVAPFQSRAAGVGHPVEAVADVRGTEARSRERDRPEGVTHGFHVIVYKVDPRPDISACNLLTKDDCRAALCDEVVPGRPEVPLVSKPATLARLAERLARATSGPNRLTITDTGCPKSK